MEDNFSTDQGVGMVWGWFRCMTFIGHFISIIITSAPIRSSGIRYQRLGTSALLQFIFFTLVHHQRIKLMSCDFCLQNAPHVAELQSLGKRRDTHTQTFIHLSSGFEWQPSHIPTHVNCCDYSNNWLGSSGRRSMGVLTCPASLQAVGETGWGQRLNGGEQGLCTHLCRCVLRKIRMLLHFSWGFCKLMRTRYLACGLLFTLYPNSLCINNGNFSSAPKQASGLKIIFRNFRNVSNPSLWWGAQTTSDIRIKPCFQSMAAPCMPHWCFLTVPHLCSVFFYFWLLTDGFIDAICYLTSWKFRGGNALSFYLAVTLSLVFS